MIRLSGHLLSGATIWVRRGVPHHSKESRLWRNQSVAGERVAMNSVDALTADRTSCLNCIIKDRWRNQSVVGGRSATRSNWMGLRYYCWPPLMVSGLLHQRRRWSVWSYREQQTPTVWRTTGCCWFHWSFGFLISISFCASNIDDKWIKMYPISTQNWLSGSFYHLNNSRKKSTK